MAENIMKLFSSMASRQEEINLLNTYKGVPMVFSACIINVGYSSIRVSTDTCQTVCMSLEKKTYIQSNQFSETLRADVENLDQADQVTTLGNFAVVDFGIGNRSEIRVQPADNIPVILVDQSSVYRLNGLISDISLDGMGLYVGWRTSIPQIFSPGKQVSISFQLPGAFTIVQTKPLQTQESGRLDRYSSGQTRYATTPLRDFHSQQSSREFQTSVQVLNPNIQTIGEVANLSQDNIFNRFRIGLRVQIDPQQRNFVQKFIAQRQAEIIQEIRERYAVMKRNPGGSQVFGTVAT